MQRRSWISGKRSADKHRQPRSTSVIHQEKLLLLFDVLQLYAVLWSTSLAWPWPRTWLRWSRWTVWTNLDALHGVNAHTPVGSSNVDNHQFGEWNQYFGFAVVVCLFPALVGVACATLARVDGQKMQQLTSRLAHYAVIDRKSVVEGKRVS